MFEFIVGSRKFLMVAVFLVVALYLLLTQKVPSNDWMSNMTTVMVAFLGSNVAEHVTNLAKTWVDNVKKDKVTRNAE